MRNTKFALRAIAGIGTAVLLLGLSGCLPFGDGAMSRIGVQSIGGVLTFTDCDPIRADEIKIRQGPEGSAPIDREWVWIAASHNNGDTVRVSTVTYGVPPDGMTVELGPDPIPTGSVIQYSVLRHEGTAVIDARQATFHLNEIADDSWLMANGQVLSEPCE